jgi:sec-independent protein translocase protein TatA
MGIGSIGFTEILVIAVIVLIFFGPQRLPEVTRALGGAMREFRRSMNEIQRELEEVDRVRKWESATTTAPPDGSPPPATVPVDAVTPAPPEETGEGETKPESPEAS